MKNFVPWLCAALFGVGAAYFYTSQTQIGEEMETLRRVQARELRDLRTQLDGARAGALAQNDDINELKKQSNEAVRLRNEIKLLNDEKLKLNQQLQSARDSAQQEIKQLRASNEQLMAAAKNNEDIVRRYNDLQKQQMRSACLSQLRQIDLAKQQWALENNEPSKAVPSVQDIGLYIRDHVIPVCPAGGNYEFGPVEGMPTCTIPGHTLSSGKPIAK